MSFAITQVWALGSLINNIDNYEWKHSTFFLEIHIKPEIVPGFDKIWNCYFMKENWWLGMSLRELEDIDNWGGYN